MNGLYPKSHLWGMHLLDSSKFDVQLISNNGNHWLFRLGRFLTRLFRNRLGNLEADFQVLMHMKNTDALYIISGDLFIVPLLKRLGLLKIKISGWFFRLPDKTPWWKFRNLWTSSFILNAYDGFLALTKKTENDFQIAMTQKPSRHRCSREPDNPRRLSGSFSI